MAPMAQQGSPLVPLAVPCMEPVDDLGRLDVAARLTEGLRDPTERTQHVGQLDLVSSAASAPSGPSQHDLVAGSYPSCDGHHSVDSEVDLTLALAIPR